MSVRQPSKSYGLIVYYIEQGDGFIQNKVHFLVHKAKDSYAFREFMRGQYKTSTIRRLFENMTENEIERIKNYTFAELWNDFWCGNYTFFECKEGQELLQNPKTHYEKEFNTSFSLYKSIRSVISEYNGRNVKRKAKVEYGFPKGRFDTLYDKNNIDTALREFKEETFIDTKDFYVHEDIVFVEMFTGTDKLNYQINYYMAKSNIKHEPKYFELPPTIKDKIIRKQFINSETETFHWKSYAEIMRMDNNEMSCTKKQIIKNAMNEIKK